MDTRTLLGLAAGTITTASFVPQVVKAWRTRSTADISLGMYALLMVGIGMWIIYGFLTASFPIIAANAATLILAAIIVTLKLKYR